MGCGSSKIKTIPAPQPPKPADDFIIGDVLGKGAFGVVNVGINKVTGQKFALKVMNRAKTRPEFLRNELEVLRLVGNEANVVGFHGAYEGDEEVTVVLELMQGGELFERLISKGPYSEHDAREAMHKVAKAIAYMHSLNVLHRDLKPENLLLTDDSAEADVKVADFGLSEVIKDQPLTRVCGTWAYSAPEMAAKVGYGLKFDTWSFGVILFILLSGYHPFDPEGDYPPEQVKALARQGLYNMDDPIWDTISTEAKDLVQRLIVVDPEERMGAKEILAHPWIHHDELNKDPIHPEMDEKIKQFKLNMRRKLRATMETAFAVSSMRRMSRESHSKRSGSDGGSVRSKASDVDLEGIAEVKRVGSGIEDAAAEAAAEE